MDRARAVTVKRALVAQREAQLAEGRLEARELEDPNAFSMMYFLRTFDISPGENGYFLAKRRI